LPVLACSTLVTAAIVLTPLGAFAAESSPAASRPAAVEAAAGARLSPAMTLESERDSLDRLIWQRITDDVGEVWSENWFAYDAVGNLVEMLVKLGPAYPVPETGPLAGQHELSYRYVSDEHGRTIARTIYAGLSVWATVLQHDEWP
jgi:hypothetical protein